MTRQVNRQLLTSMLRHMRPAYSVAEQAFCNEYLYPVFGVPDKHGNYIHIVGDQPDIMFTAHTDTVHKVGGLQEVVIENSFVTAPKSNCLGADCTTGIWLMLGMIEAGIEGVYVAHAAEEVGGIGSSSLVKDKPTWLNYIDICISFDRYGTDSIITHQSYMRTASDVFASSLSAALGMRSMKPDTNGLYTDSFEYAEVVAECTNISVGYYDQHTRKESQDLYFAETLLERLCKADWSLLDVSRDPTLPDVIHERSMARYDNYYEDSEEELLAIKRLLMDRGESVAKLLLEYGLTAEAILDEIAVDDSTVYRNYYY
jgi:hypothetical protein